MAEKLLVNNIEALTHSLDLAMEKDENVVLFGEDAGFEGGVFRATQGLQAKYGVARVFDTPISEAAIAGVAIGASLAGLKPWRVTISRIFISSDATNFYPCSSFKKSFSWSFTCTNCYSYAYGWRN